MRQSTIIFGSLLLAFVIYITLRGQLPAYLGLFTSQKTATTNNSTTNNNNTANGFTGSIDSIYKYIDQFGQTKIF